MVFIHGLGGDAFTTWRHGDDDSTSWPHWLGREFPEVGVWSLGYAAAPSKWARPLGWFFRRRGDAGHGMALPDRGLQVLDRMAQGGLGERPLFFICHSLGGLVAKQILRGSSDSVEARLQGVFANTRAVLFLATPHAGAPLASIVGPFRTVFGATVTLQGLEAHDAHLGNLFDWYRNHSQAEGIRTSSYFELRSLAGVTIVNRTTAHPGVGSDPVGIEEDHLSIAKPRDGDAQVCGAARYLIRNHLLAPAPVILKEQAPSGGQRATPIPHELPPAAEEFFGRAAELERLTDRLRSNKNTAVAGPAGLGKTALAAKALFDVVSNSTALAGSPFPDGVVFLDLYTFRGDAEGAWSALANKLAGAEFMERSPARERATEACRGRRLLVVIEGGEEADGNAGRADIHELLGVLSPQNRRLLLTRLNTQAPAAETVVLREALDPADAGRLLDSLTQGRVSGTVRARVLELLDGHPLALTWAGGLLARGDDEPEQLCDEWELAGLPGLSDPSQAQRTLEWLFERSVRGLDDPARRALAAAGLLGRAPFPLVAIGAVLGDPGQGGEGLARDALRPLVQRDLLRLAKQVDHREFTHVLGYHFARRESGSEPLIRTRLGGWLHGHLGMALRSADAVSDGQASLTGSLEHLAALLRADDDQSLWNPLAKFALYEMAKRLEEMGRLPLMALALKAVAGWTERFPADKAEEPAWRRERSVLFNRQGDVLSVQGDLAGALTAFQEALGLSRALAEADPSNAGWQRDLGVSHEKIGDVLRDQGDLAGALTAFQEALGLRRALAEADPSNAGWQRDLSVSHEKIGDVLSDQGDLAGALTAFQVALGLSRALAEADPSNAGWQRDLGVSHETIGDVLRAQGDLAGALTAFRQALRLRRALAEADPSNAVWQRDLSFSLTRMGEFREQRGDMAEALCFAEESLVIDERLAALDRSNVTWRNDVEVSRALVARLRG